MADGSGIRKEKVVDSKISGYVWTGPKNVLKRSRKLLITLVKWSRRRRCLSSLLKDINAPYEDQHTNAMFLHWILPQYLRWLSLTEQKAER